MLRQSLAVVALPVSLVVLLGAAPLSSAEAPAVAGAEPRTDDAYIVSFEADTVEELAEAVERAGGQVADVLEPLGIALVRADDPWFLADPDVQDGVITGSASNRLVGASDPAAPSRIDDPAPADALISDMPAVGGVRQQPVDPSGGPGSDPLEGAQWGNAMVGATHHQAHRAATGSGVTVAIIDTGIDGSHPDLAGNIDVARSRDLVQRVDGVATDVHGHGTHVAGIVAAERNGLGTAGVAPGATIVSLRAATDGGGFFAYEVASAIVTAVDRGADIAVMSFFTLPWLYNCASADDYVTGDVSAEEIAEQAFVRRTILDAVDYAHQRGVTLVSAVGNENVDLSAPHRTDATSPLLPPGAARPRVVTNECLDLPNEAPQVVSVAAVGPSGGRASYSNYGLGSVDLAAPGGWIDDPSGQAYARRAENLVLSTFPEEVARRRGLITRQGEPTSMFTRRDCTPVVDACGIYTYRSGTSMAAPYVAGVAALVIEHHSLNRAGGGADVGTAAVPRRVAEILYWTASSRSCAGEQFCQGTAADNSLYGRGIVDAHAAVGG